MWVLFKVEVVGVDVRVVVVVRSVLEDGVVVEGVELVDDSEERVKARLTLFLRGILVVIEVEKRV